jgi:UPF0755 protein
VYLGRFILRISVFVLVPAIIALSTFLFLRNAFLVPFDRHDKKPIFIELAAGRTIKEVSKELESRGALRHWWSLWFLARISHKDKKIQACEYEMRASLTPKEMLNKLVNGEMYKRKLLVKEGDSLKDIAAAVEQAGLMSGEEFIKGASDRENLTHAGIRGDSFEGYLFPETYFFCRPSTARDVIWRMLEEGEQHWPNEFTDEANKLNFSRHEILTLASIIEKESGNVDEQPIISSVFQNRLAKGMKLQSDPTIIYGLPNFDGTIHQQDKENPHPYNTYVNYGLPPGPICNPGQTAIRAALFPKPTAYLYFVARGDGTHVFSTTYQEHQAAVDTYIRGHTTGAAEVPLAEPSPSPSPTSHAIVTLSPSNRK